MMRLDTVVPQDEEGQIGAGVPDLPKPEITGGLSAPLDQSAQLLKDINEDKQCRICLDDDQCAKNPLITPCKCIGSVRWIHIDCLKSWLALKKQCHYQDGVHSYYWEQLTCELCKTVLNLKLITNGDV